MPAPSLPVDWDAIQMAAVAGVPYPQIALQFGLVDKHGRPDTNAIRQRASRGNWPIPARVRQVAKNMVRKHLAAGGSLPAQSSKEHKPQSNKGREAATSHELSSNLMGNRENVTERHLGRNEGRNEPENGSLEAQSSQVAAVTIASALLSNAQETGILASGIVRRSVERIKDTELPLTSFSDLAAATKLSRLIAGLDKPETAVQVNLFGPASAVSSSASSFIELDAEPLEEQEESYNEADL